MNAPAELPDDYLQLLDRLKSQVRQARIRATRIVNTELLTLYWEIGHAIVERQQVEGWGTKVIDRLAIDLRSAFPEMRGFSRTNLKYMRQIAAVWTRDEIGQQPVGQLPWGHVTVLLDKLDGRSDRDWYAASAAEHGWSRNVLQNQIRSGLRHRIGAAPSNFRDHLPVEDSDLAQQLVRDPYVFDFLDITERVAERELESALMLRLEQFLLELGHGFAFVGRQYHFEIGDQDFYIDLLFFNWVQARFVVVELKVGRFEPEYVGKLGFYVSWIDDNLRDRKIHAPTVGILLCAGRNDNVVRYSLAGTTAPLAVADYTYETLPSPIRDLVPTDDEIAAAVEATVSELDSQIPDHPDR
ncbi:PDDEXK nuclease domain-containing protein [Rhodococcus sp. OK302]|uniref:PDDEXK nuclease domain-containing protein n=1 Tax=Rhodococcus sp. OK302 TaxID=1882769 RepID=UPI000B93A327|nr:PDDEXK nuclease domain-containing protein [Rhodococcus sp. OK302]